jgi:hypothetical protein
MIAHHFISESRRHLVPILNDNGGILYSAFSTLTQGAFYILGLNPGGALGSGDTLAQCLDSLPQYKDNAYLDEDWSSDTRHYCRGGHPLQRHLFLLMKELGEDLRRVCAANLIFSRSPDQYGADYPKRGHICWPVHQMILNIVKPEVIIAFGNGGISPYAFLAHKHQETLGTWPEESTQPAQYRTWQCKAFQTKIDDKDILVLGLPHLSRYTIEGRPAVMNWIKEKIREHNNCLEPISG